MSVEFCDTNIFVYAYDLSAGSKRTRARGLLQTLWASGDGTLSVQVLQELFVTLMRKISPPLSTADARTIVSDLARWRVVEPTRRDVLEAIDAALRWQLSFWDAMIVVAAQRAGAAVIWSEDLNDGQDFGGTVVRNPFRANA
jgi:predicted nucleic acid-binding protein